jgi:hypothetical protein
MVRSITLRQSRWYRVALAALEALIDLMEEDGSTKRAHRQVQTFAPELVPGESVAPTGAQPRIR